jgi:hypothetical protein
VSLSDVPGAVSVRACWHRRERMGLRRSLWRAGGGGLAVVALIALAVDLKGVGATNTSAALAQGLGSQTCGVERWRIKTLADPIGRRAHFTLRNSSVIALRGLVPPTDLPQNDRVRPVELRAYRVVVNFVEAKIEADRDIHLVVSDPRRATATMIVEFPDAPACTAGASASRVRQMRRARSRFVRACGRPGQSRFTRLRGRATIVGVGFFDRVHGQTGVAPNGIELHPVLSLRVRSCTSL